MNLPHIVANHLCLVEVAIGHVGHLVPLAEHFEHGLLELFVVAAVVVVAVGIAAVVVVVAVVLAFEFV